MRARPATPAGPPTHTPVLPREVLGALAPRAGETFVDATAGRGGHAAMIAPRLLPDGRVILCDLDPGNLAFAGERARSAAPGLGVATIEGNFAELPHALRRAGTPADVLLADLGFSSTQMDDPERGFSFQRDGPLDMRLGPSVRASAADLVNTLPEAELARIFAELGEERHAARVARKLVRARAATPIRTTGALASVVRSAVPPTPGGIDPATRTFQALRIAVNDELGSLEALLAGVEEACRSRGAGWLKGGARVAIISFHSLEDRAVKQCFARCAGTGASAVGPIAPAPEEVVSNPRARSAKLRVLTLAVDTPSPSPGR